ncbi:MAG TPA: transcriptional regulator, partial [Flavobacteriaceae bacterium]|nr:transcriptional regulator [Flavobacteriaceae bacterium]
YNALKKGIDKILAYKKTIFIYPDNAVHPYPKKTLHGFRKFCVEHSIDFEILNGIYEDTIVKKGDLFITIEESDLVNLVHHARDRNFTLGKDIGIISYNETPLKELLDITVISTSFNMMGKTAAKMILDKKKGEIKNPFDFIDRGSM